MYDEPTRPAYIIGVSLGQVHEDTAVVVLERQGYAGGRGPAGNEASYELRHLERLRAGTSYSDIMKRLADLERTPPLYRSWDAYETGRYGATVKRRCESFPTIGMDATSVGRPVVDTFRWGSGALRSDVHPFLVTAGDSEVHDVGVRRVPLRDLVGLLQLRLQGGRVRFVQGPLTTRLQRQLVTFKAKINLAASAAELAWRVDADDDLVYALAAALWAGQFAGPVMSAETARALVGALNPGSW